ncbi:transglycosylase domain-containing protein [Aeromicrobium sp. UC242_57]|uniref:transglycosylase domain-containing protein n=1 Tax=Aeromicrobium sp. UC242_57 TaxID=3374624 RepID=UPI0037A29B78
MAKAGAITADEAAKFADRLPKVVDKKNINRFSGSKGYLLQLVKDKMVSELKFDPSEIDGGGLRIVTTFDYDDQMDAIAAIKQFRPEGAKELNQSLVSVEPGTGAVRAMYAGRDYLKNQFNWATNGTQPGSTFKPFAVIAALENGYSLNTKLNGNSPLYDDSGKMLTTNQGDSGGASFGNVSLTKATEKSINTAFVDLVQQMDDGPQKVLDAARQAGVPNGPLNEIKADGLPLVTPLGYVKVAPVDMANAYATIAAEGKRADWYVIQKVTDRQGATQYKHKVRTKQAIPEDVAADTIAAMQTVIRTGSGTNARTVCSATAGKTGTATAGETKTQHVSSSWFAGFTPKAATAVMYNRGKNGNADLEGYMLPAFFGGQIPAKTFQAYMNASLDPSDCGTFPPAANIKGDKGTVYVAPKPKPKKTKKPTPKPTRTTRPAPTTPAPTTPAPTTPAPPEPTTPVCTPDPLGPPCPDGETAD